MVRLIGELLAAGRIGKVNHVRLEMDEDFMADPAAPFGLKSEASSGYGATDDFGVHPLSLLQVLLGRVTQVMAHLSRPYPDRPVAGGGRRAVETHDVASILFQMHDDISGAMALSRTAWGRKGRIALQIFGSAGTIVFDQERFNELQIFEAAEGPNAGFRHVLAGPQHEPYGHFVPAPGHGLGFNDLKIIECRELLRALRGEVARVIDFAAGLQIEQTVHAMARSHGQGTWVEV